jgi:hypothetical protein
MRAFFRDIDHLLRGRFTEPEDLREGRIVAPVGTLVAAGLLLGITYGIFMGLYSVLRPAPSAMQLVATSVKVPMLFLLTLVVTFPSLYVFSALSRSRLAAPETLRLLLAALGVNLAILASFGPVTGFFTLSTESYPFMVVLNVLFFSIGGIVGLAFLARALVSVFHEDVAPVPVASEADEVEGEVADDEEAAEQVVVETTVVELPPEARGRLVLRTWILIYAVVGAQMGWILRPFVGHPGLPFEWFREREGNFFQAFFRAVGALFT